MAYASTITVTEVGASVTKVPGRKGYVLSIAETGGTTTGETEVDLAAEGLPLKGQIVAQYNVGPPVGTAATIDPVIGLVTDPAAASGWRVENDAAAALVHNQPAQPARYSGTSLFHRTNYDAGTDNACTIVYLILEGW